MSLSDQEKYKILELIVQGNKLEAVKRIRDLSGMSLADAKEFVEKVERNEASLDELGKSAIGNEVNNVQEEVIQLLIKGRKLEAVKILKSKYSLNLLEAKNTAEELEKKLIASGKMSKPSAQTGCSMTIVKLICAIVFATGIYFLVKKFYS